MLTRGNAAGCAIGTAVGFIVALQGSLILHPSLSTHHARTSTDHHATTSRMDFLRGGGPSEWGWPLDQRPSAGDQARDSDAHASGAEAKFAAAEAAAAAATAQAKAAEAKAAALAARLADLEGEIEQALEARAKAEADLAKAEERAAAAASLEGRGGEATAVAAPEQSSSSTDEGMARTWLRYLRGCYPLAQSCDPRHHWSTPFVSEPHNPWTAPWALEGTIDPTRVVAGPQTPVDPTAADPPKVSGSV